MDPHDAAADVEALAEGIARMQAVAALEVTRRPQAWAGLRTFSPDRVPAIGFDPDAPGFFWLAGQGGSGVQTSPAASLLAAALARGADLPGELTPFGIDPARYDPARFR